MTQAIIIEAWGDLICPMCPIGHAKLKEGIASFLHKDAVKVVYRSFRLRPGLAPQTVDAYIKNKHGPATNVASLLSQVEQWGADAGLIYRMGKTQAGDTMDAHRVVHFARIQGLQMQTVERFHVAHFAEEENLFDKDTLARLASQVGLERNAVTTVLAGDDFRREVEADEQAARNMGVSSVPFFLFNGQIPVSGGHEGVRPLGQSPLTSTLSPPGRGSRMSVRRSRRIVLAARPHAGIGTSPTSFGTL
jgi:predicted DsbA family dithiol-disulfide isomerase